MIIDSEDYNREVKSMKIAFTGSHCVGKTTTGNDIANMLYIPFVTEVARKYNVSTKDMDEYAWIERQIMRYQIKKEKKEFGVFDRTVYDVLAYTRFKLRHSHPAFVDMIKAQVIAHVNTFDLIVYVPPMIPLVEDGFRYLEFQKEIDTELKNIYEEFKVPIYTLKSVNRYARIIEVLSKLIELKLV